MKLLVIFESKETDRVMYSMLMDGHSIVTAAMLIYSEFGNNLGKIPLNPKNVMDEVFNMACEKYDELTSQNTLEDERAERLYDLEKSERLA